MTKISIIVPVYNVENYLDRCISSILNQTYSDFELILIDDGSPDSSPAMCDKYARENEKIKVIHKENAGPSSARNRGLELAQGEYVLFVDSDDFVEPEYIETLVTPAESGTADMVVSNAFLLDKGADKAPISSNESFVVDAKDFLKIGYGVMLGSIWNKLYCRAIIKENNITFPENMTLCEDVVFNANYFKHVKKIAYINKCIYNYCIDSQREHLTVSSKTRSADNVFLIYDALEAAAKALGTDMNIYGRELFERKFSALEERLRMGIEPEKIIKDKRFKKLIKYANKNKYDNKYLLLLRLGNYNLIKQILK